MAEWRIREASQGPPRRHARGDRHSNTRPPIQPSKFNPDEGIVTIDRLWAAHLEIQSNDLGVAAEDRAAQLDIIRVKRKPVEVLAHGDQAAFYLFPRHPRFELA